MANFRNFTLYNNARTESIGLNDFDGYLVTTPTGVGVYMTNSYFRVGNKRILTDQQFGYRNITMVIDIFAPTRTEVEKRYAAIRNFISRNRRFGFKLAYKPYDGDDAEERYINCDIKEFDKSEKYTSRIMSVPLIIEPRSMWMVDKKDEDDASSEGEKNINRWSFDLDSNFPSVTEYNTIMQNQTGEQELSIVGYDKSVFPDGIDITANITDNANGRSSQARVRLDNKEAVEDVVTVKAKTNDKVYDYYMQMTFDLANSSIKCKPIKMKQGEDSGDVQFSYTLQKTPYGDSVIKVEFVENDSINWTRSIIIEYQTNGGGYGFDILFCFAGEKVCYKTLEDCASVTNTIVNVDYLVEDENANLTWSISGDLLIGSTNYMESFDEDSDIVGYYNIAMYGRSSKVGNITNDGDTEIPLKVRIHGGATNPVVKIIPSGQDVPIQTAKINLVIPDGEYVEIDSDPENTGAWIYHANGRVENIIANLDQTTNMFLTAPQGDYDIFCIDDNNDSITADVFYRKEYVGA